MTVESLKIDWDECLHNNDKNSGLIAIGVKEVYEYSGSKRTNRVIGYAIEVVDTLNKFEKTSVKVMGLTKKPFEIGDNDEYLNVYFVGLQGRAYMDYATNTVKFSVTAEDVRILNDVG